MRRFLLFVCVLLIQGEVFSEDFGLFKKSWNSVSVNKEASVTYIAGDLLGYPASDSISVRSISFKLINVEYENWKDALKGKKIRHCALKVDADLRKISNLDRGGYISLTFFDKDELQVRSAHKRGGKVYYHDSVEIYLPALKAGAPQKVLFMPDASCGEPVRVEVE